jgi:predicted transcriptional regulator
MSRTLTLQLEDNIYQLFDEAAKAENRPLASFIETSVLARIRQQRASTKAGEPSELQRAVEEAEEGIAQGKWVRHSEVEAKLRRWAAGEA